MNGSSSCLYNGAFSSAVGHTCRLSQHALPSFSFMPTANFGAETLELDLPPASSSPLMSDLIIPPQMFHFSWKVREGAKKDRVSSSFSPLSFSAFRAAAKEFSAPPTFDIRQQGPDTRRHRRPRAQGCLSELPKARTLTA